MPRPRLAAVAVALGIAVLGCDATPGPTAGSVTLTVSPPSRYATARPGNAAPGDQAVVMISGDNATSAIWSAAARHAWIALAAASGTGSGTLAWTRSAAALPPGLYVDTITIVAPGAAGSPASIIDTLLVSADAVPLVLAALPRSGSVTVMRETPAPDADLAISLTGDGAGAAPWALTHSAAWAEPSSAAGTGSSAAVWHRITTGLATGTWIDSVTITSPAAHGSPLPVLDSLVVTAAAPPLTLMLNPASFHVTAVLGGSAPGGSASVHFSGSGAGTATWTATTRQAWSVPIAGSGSGDGTLSWTRDAAGLPAGLHVDTVTVTAPGAAGSPAIIVDTLTVLPALAISASPASILTTVTAGETAPDGSGTVALSGTGAANAHWSATKRKSWTTLTTSSGTGSGMVTWNRATAALVAGTYVDTISVAATGAAGSPVQIVDSVVVTAAPVPLGLAASPRSHRVSVVAGATVSGANSTVTLTGSGAASAHWSATKRKSWTTLTTSSGTGSGVVTWNRATAALAAGTYVDTISVTVGGATGSPTAVIDTIVVTAAPPSGDTPDLGLNADLHGKRIFPANDPWNRPVDTAQVDPGSNLILGAIGLTKSLHPDFGASSGGAPFGIAYVVVPDAQPRLPVSFNYADESDAGPYPIPANPPIEPGDRHLLMITQGEWKLFELYGATPPGSGWHAGSGAIFDLATNTQRPAGWTSADAAGLPILPGLVRYDEVYLHGEITHALRFTVAHTRAAYVAPASHVASSLTGLQYAPMGMRVRLKASFDISGYPAAAQVILRALKKYGMIVADNGSDFYFTGTADARWNDAVNNMLKQVKVGDFEVVRMSGVVTL